jgi:hypothetical protein
MNPCSGCRFPARESTSSPTGLERVQLQWCRQHHVSSQPKVGVILRRPCDSSSSAARREFPADPLRRRRPHAQAQDRSGQLYSLFLRFSSLYLPELSLLAVPSWGRDFEEIVSAETFAPSGRSLSRRSQARRNDHQPDTRQLGIKSRFTTSETTRFLTSDDGLKLKGVITLLSGPLQGTEAMSPLSCSP